MSRSGLPSIAHVQRQDTGSEDSIYAQGLNVMRKFAEIANEPTRGHRDWRHHGYRHGPEEMWQHEAHNDVAIQQHIIDRIFLSSRGGMRFFTERLDPGFRNPRGRQAHPEECRCQHCSYSGYSRQYNHMYELVQPKVTLR